MSNSIKNPFYRARITRSLSLRCSSLLSAATQHQSIRIKSDEFIDQEKLQSIGDTATVSAATRMIRAPVTLRVSNLPSSVSTAMVPSVHKGLNAATPIVMLHSFDSSCLEFRRLQPLLDQQDHPSYALDLVGWGFTDHSFLVGQDPIPPIGPEAKREHLRAFVEQELQGKPIVLVGASISGAVAVDFALSYPHLVNKLILLDPQVFIDGLAPMSLAPQWLLKLLVRLLQTEWIRSAAGVSAYFDKKTYATEDAVKTGRLHTFVPGWLEANVAFIRSGGYSMSKRVKELSSASFETLVLWGEMDEILADKSYPTSLQQSVPSLKFKFVPQCGHTPHLERAAFVAKEISDFIR